MKLTMITLSGIHCTYLCVKVISNTSSYRVRHLFVCTTGLFLTNTTNQNQVFKSCFYFLIICDCYQSSKFISTNQVFFLFLFFLEQTCDSSPQTNNYQFYAENVTPIATFRNKVKERRKKQNK